ncbi:hypothetical protein CPB83DRAFT_231382 [Crepidotus variabilis]|uniref:Uncharacterized protein n=1 Tax=Crepidotus variabilis TaxID=179855 RepID=A0A9P6EUD4_9AGAR|nr:hypothetical protein CPB83DRAFT_231382 [Crepidotus variabilis]
MFAMNLRSMIEAIAPFVLRCFNLNASLPSPRRQHYGRIWEPRLPSNISPSRKLEKPPDESDLIQCLWLVPSLTKLTLDGMPSSNIFWHLLPRHILSDKEHLTSRRIFLPNLQHLKLTGRKTFPWSMICSVMPIVSHSDRYSRPLSHIETTFSNVDYYAEVEPNTISRQDLQTLQERGIIFIIHDNQDHNFIDLSKSHLESHGQKALSCSELRDDPDPGDGS